MTGRWVDGKPSTVLKAVEEAEERGPGELYHSLLNGSVSDSLNYEHIARFKVERLDGPLQNRGYKGDLEPGSDPRDIAEQWGDGHYRVSACNSQGVPLAKKEHRLSLGMGGSGSESSPTGTLLEALRADKQAELARLEKMIDQAQGNAQRVTDVVTRATEAQIQREQQNAERERERERAASERDRERQEGFMTALFAMMQQGFQQQMSLMQTASQQQAQWNNPATVLGLFTQGMQLGRDVGEGRDTEPWVQAIQEGVKGIGELTTLAKLKSPAEPRSAKPRAVTQGTSAPSRGSQGTSSNPLNREECTKVVKLKRVCEAKGIDFDGLVTMALEQVDVQDDDETEPEDGHESEAATESATGMV